MDHLTYNRYQCLYIKKLSYDIFIPRDKKLKRMISLTLNVALILFRNIIRQAVNSGGDDHLIFGGATSGSYVNGGFGLESVGEHIHGLGLPIVIFADIRIDERRWPWPWMLSSNDENITVIDIPQTEDGAVDIAFLKKELGL